MPFRKIQSPNKDLMRVQDAVESALKPLFISPIVNGVLVQNITLSSTASTQFEHFLKRQPIGYIIIDRTSTDAVYRTAWDVNTISLRAAANSPTISLWIF